MTKNLFSELGLSEPLLRALTALGYEQATPIQAQAIPLALAGRDIVGCAQTGTGKTAAFTLPMLDRLYQSRLQNREHDSAAGERRRDGFKGPKPRALRALILTPTRELAAQIADSLTRYGKFTSHRHTVVYGGVSQFHQVKALRHGVDTLVATPGRLLDLKSQGYIDLSKIEILVLDEADQMLDMGFLPDLKRIVAAVPTERQTLMFSATMPDDIRRLADQWLKSPAEIETTPVATPADRIEQRVHLVDRKRKAELLTFFLKETPRSRTLVFSRTKHGADKIVKHLTKEGVRAAAIHGNKSQGARTRTLEAFKGKHPPVLVATDIAARGLDIRDVSHIVNFDLPDTPETYVHRIGRTARAGASGVAVSFCASDERKLLRQIERLMKQSITVEPTRSGFETTEPVAEQPRSAPQRNGGARNGATGNSGAATGARRRPFKSRFKAGTKQSGQKLPATSADKREEGRSGTSQTRKPKPKRPRATSR
jgi:ATP-dependent RNA helicase RhlE